MLYAPQDTEAGIILRRMRRGLWRAMWRAERIVRRESAKAANDVMVLGIGYMKAGDLGDWERDGTDILKRVPPENVRLWTGPTPK